MSKSTYIKKIMAIILIIIASVAGFITSDRYFNQNKEVNFKSLLVYPEAKKFTGFKLTDQNNKEITIDDFKGKWTLMFFGFTSCPDVCPTTLTEIQKVYKLVKSKSPDSIPQVLFVSVDPDRDTPDVLKNYINFFNSEFIASTADNANIISLTTQIGVAYHVEEHDDTTLNYNVDHTAAIFVINPDKKLHGIFPTPHDATIISADLLLLLEGM